VGLSTEVTVIEGRLRRLAQLLDGARAFWAPRPFIEPTLPWERAASELARALRALTEEQIEAYETHPERLEGMPARWRAWVAQLAQYEPPALRCSTVALSYQRPRGVAQRKWAQIHAFASVVAASRPVRATRWLDWCAGKGHLGRTLAHAMGMPFQAVERDPALCREGERLARAASVAAEFACQDVLAASCGAAVAAEREEIAAVALHACGRLHHVLLERAVREGFSMVALAPCCHHRYFDERPRPLSAVGREVDPRLELTDRRLVGLNEAVVRPRRAALRRREQAHRLALDLLLRDLTGLDRYRPLGPAPTAWIDLPFEDFAQRLAAKNGVTLSRAALCRRDYERLGWERHHDVRALGMVRGLFRRPIEIWLLLDLAQHLVEQGFEVTFGCFCEESITPRNLLIIAER
jgi:hypothetical protein